MVDLRITEMPLEEILNKGGGGGRQPSPRDLALDDLVEKAGDRANADKAFAWAFAPDKKATAIQAAKRAIERKGKVGQVFASAKGDQIIFAQQPLRKPRK